MRNHPYADLDLAREDLAAGLRAAARLGLHEGVCNHFSIALPDDRILINPQGLHWDEVTAGDMVVADMQGKRLEGRHPVEITAACIHSGIHRARADATCVLHTHMPYGTALTLLEGGRLAWSDQNSLRFYGRTAYDDDYQGVAFDGAEGDRMAAALGDGDVLFLASHGVIVCGPTMAHAFDDLYYLERACMHQVLARSTGGRLRQVDEAVAARTAADIAAVREQSDLHFAALKRLLDRDSAGWRALE
ncbi:aldolase [Marinibaculum pumilum]|uniref:Aldolase n=1 Tax=Marinibaculum pumilum TaxID=1766165 RepID=A0ABV7L3D2_9PROT